MYAVKSKFQPQTKLQYTEDDEIDILILTELAFIGSTFFSFFDIYSYAQESGSGAIFEWCSK